MKMDMAGRIDGDDEIQHADGIMSRGLSDLPKRLSRAAAVCQDGLK
jgi:hypothetical protein